MTRLYMCPCCDQLTLPRRAPMTEREMQAGYGRMLRKGLTRAQLLDEHAETLDAIAPGFTDWLRERDGVTAWTAIKD